MRRIGYMTLALVLAVAVGLAFAQEKKAEKVLTASGKVTAVADDSVTVTKDKDTWKFSVDNATKVVAKGAGTKTAEKKEAGAAGPKLTEVLHEGDMVVVKYHDMGGGTLHAAEVRVRTQAPKMEKK